MLYGGLVGSNNAMRSTAYSGDLRELPPLAFWKLIKLWTGGVVANLPKLGREDMKDFGLS